MISTAQGRRQHIRDFLSILMEAHLDPASARPTLGGLTDCLIDDSSTGMFHDETLTVSPEPYRPHPAGNLRRCFDPRDIWIHLASTDCYLHIPCGLSMRYKFEMAGDHAALSLQAVSELELSDSFSEVPVDRLIIDPTLVTILVPTCCNREDIEIAVP